MFYPSPTKMSEHVKDSLLGVALIKEKVRLMKKVLHTGSWPAHNYIPEMHSFQMAEPLSTTYQFLL